MSPEQVKKVTRDQRIKLYNLICYCGAGLLIVMDKSALRDKLSVHGRAAAITCFLYFIFSLVCMLLGIIASSFPETAAFSMEISWNGSLQAFLFTIAYLHLSVMEYYADMWQVLVSFVLASTVWSFLWYFVTKESSTVNNRDADGSELRYS